MIELPSATCTAPFTTAEPTFARWSNAGVDVGMLGVKRSVNRGDELQQAFYRQAHLAAAKLRHDRGNRAIRPFDGNAERATVRVFDVGMALAITSAE